MEKYEAAKSSPTDPWVGLVGTAKRVHTVAGGVALVIVIAATVVYGLGWLSFSTTNPRLPQFVAVLEDVAAWTWANGGRVVRDFSLLLIALALFKAAMRIETVYNIVRTFNQARSPIAELRTSVDGVRTTAREFGDSMGTLRDASEVLKSSAPVLSELNERLKAISEQIITLQEEAISQRTDSGDPPSIGSTGSAERKARNDANWEEMRNIWRQNNQRLEGVIEQKLVGARQQSYGRMPRTNYPAIMDKLKQHNVLSVEAYEASMKLHDTFMSYKPRNRDIPDEVIGAMRVLEAQLELLVGEVALQPQ